MKMKISAPLSKQQPMHSSEKGIFQRFFKIKNDFKCNLKNFDYGKSPEVFTSVF